MKTGKFFLYYSIILQVILCMFLFNTKLEWSLLIGTFYVMLLFSYGLILEIKDANTSIFIDGFNNSRIISEMNNIISSVTGLDVFDYLKYLIAIPVVMNLISVKLISNYEGNREIRKSKSRTKNLDTVKTLFCISILLLLIITIFGFPLEVISGFIKRTPLEQLGISIPLLAIPALYIISTVELVMSVYIYKSY
jgi:hypothetical protein